MLLALVQAYGISVGLEGGNGIVTDPGIFFRISAVITLVGGTMFLMWLGEQITARGIGNGISLIIFAGIVAGLPAAISGTLELGRTGALSTGLILAIIVLAIVVIAVIVFFERAQRRLLIQYPKRQVGNRMFQGDTSHLPLKLNTSGVIPPIFASSLLLLPATIAGFSATTRHAGLGLDDSGRARPRPAALHGALCGDDRVLRLLLHGDRVQPEGHGRPAEEAFGLHPRLPPGERTAEYIDYVLTRITVIGAIYLVLVCLLPEFLISATGVPFYLGGTSLLIVVSVTLDTVAQIQGHLIAHQYEGLIKKSKLRGGKRGK